MWSTAKAEELGGDLEPPPLQRRAAAEAVQDC